jgi:hypothetical protein
MSNQVITPKIILTNSPDIASKFSDAKSYYSFLESAQKILSPEYLARFSSEQNFSPLFLTTDNSNILNFEFSIQGSNAEQKGLRIVLDFFDPKDDFERLLFSRGLRDLVKTRSFYLAFGTGLDMTNWSNFHVVSLLHIESFQDYDQPKTIRLHLVSTAGLHEIAEDIFKNYSKDIKSINMSTSLSVSAAVQPKSWKASEDARNEYDDNRNKIKKELQDLRERLDTVNKEYNKYQNLIFEAQRKIEVAEQRYNSSITKISELARLIPDLGGLAPTGPRGESINTQIREETAKLKKYNEDKTTFENQKAQHITEQSKLNPKIASLTKEINPLLYEYSSFQTNSVELSRLDIEQGIGRPKLVLETVDPFNLAKFYKLFRGYSALDYVIKQIIQKFLKSIFVQQNNVLFIYDDTLSNFEASGSAWFNSALLGGRDPFTERDRPFLVTEEIEVKLQKFIPRLSLLTKKVPEDKDITPIYQQSAEKANEYSRIVTASLNVERQEGETDDKFREKLQETLNSFEEAFTAQYELIEDPCVLYRETDLLIVNLFIDFIENEAPELITEFNLVKNQPLILFGKRSIIRALLYGESFLSSSESFTNKRAKDYTDKVLKQIVANQNYNLYGSKKNTLSPLQSFLEESNIKTNEFLTNTKKTLANILIFRHNVENGNVLSITIDDYKAYNKYLAVPTDIDVLNFSSLTLADNLLFAEVNRAVRTTDALTGVDFKKIDNFIEQIINSKQFKNSLIVQEITTLLQTEEGRKLFTSDSEAEVRIAFSSFVSELATKSLVNDISLEVQLENSERSPEDVFRKMVRDIERSTFRTTIKTLPFFFVSNFSFLLEPCLLISKRQKLLGYDKRSQFDSAVTGGYVLVGLKHKITKDSATSEFILQKISKQ